MPHGVIFKAPLLLLLNRGLAVGPWSQKGCPATHWRSSWLTKSLLSAKWDWQTETARISRGHLYISFQNTHTFPFNLLTSASCAENLLLMARSTFNMQQMEGCQWGLGYGDCTPYWGDMTTHKRGCSGFNTKLHLMGRFQFWRSWECGVPLYGHYWQVYADPEW